ncbi:MAG: NAD(P)-binding domain-containing protein [Alphaproteobacteria bacterium]|nr:NAD(P)-binding domain-containing protein [Alphaproteobacteria bacterium]
MTQSCDVAIIGAGPHGLSLAAHLAARGVDFRIFGRPMTTWSERMPKTMMLKSDGFASNLSAPARESTLKAWSARNNLPYADQGMPVPLDTFLSYAAWFQKRYVPNVEKLDVTAVEAHGDGYAVTLENGETLRARSVVLAVGITWFEHTPEVLRGMPASLVSHAAAHRDVARFNGREVAVIGSGSSAVDIAHLLHQEGAKVRIVARKPHIEYNRVPDAADETLVGRTLRPASGIGRGWKSLFCAEAPLLFYHLPPSLKRRAVDSHMHPAAGWFMREKVEGVIPMSLGRALHGAEARDGKIALTLEGGESFAFDHVIAATGYRMDLRRIPFVEQSLLARASQADGAPILSDSFETPVAGLYAVGPAALETFGPLMRFMVGAEFAAPRVAQRLERVFGASRPAKAA